MKRGQTSRALVGTEVRVAAGPGAEYKMRNVVGEMRQSKDHNALEDGEDVTL